MLRPKRVSRLGARGCPSRRLRESRGLLRRGFPRDCRWRERRSRAHAFSRLLETHGVLALRLPNGTDLKVDAFSTCSGRRPLVFLSRAKDDKSRSRFDAAHELGHLIVHPDTEPCYKLVENQAHAFAAAFLMPEDEIAGDLPRRIDWPASHELKRKWGVSLRALVHRAHSLSRLSEASYRRANQQFSFWDNPEPRLLRPQSRLSCWG